MKYGKVLSGTFLFMIVLLFCWHSVRADEVRIYTEDGIPDGTQLYTWGPGVSVTEIKACNTPEGIASQKTIASGWGGWGIKFDIQADFSEFQDGTLQFWVHTPCDLKVEFTCSGNQHRMRYISQHGWNGTDTWQEIIIPICDFFLPNPCDPSCLQHVEYAFMTTAESSCTFLIDDVRWHKTIAHPGRSTVEIFGRELFVNWLPFAVKGVDYSPPPSCRGWQYDWNNHPERYTSDFQLIHDAGMNVIRTYRPLTRTAALDEAYAHGIYIIQQFGVDPLKLTCSEGKEFLKSQFVDMVSEWKDHPAILMWVVGNEVNLNLPSGVDLYNDWFQLLNEMARLAHEAETEAGKPPYHPVTTANGDSPNLEEICNPSLSDDTAMPYLDLWAIQLYRDCRFGKDHSNDAFEQYRSKSDCGRPLLMTEFGLDAYNNQLSFEDETMQANCVENLLNELQSERAVAKANGVGIGGCIFEWQDEYWKSGCNPGAWCVQDTCIDWWNYNYTDPAMQEEWWGLCRNWSDPDTRTCRQSYTTAGNVWRLGEASGCEPDWMRVTTYDKLTGAITISFKQTPSATDHTVHYGYLSLVSSHTYSGSACNLGATGNAVFQLPEGSFYWVIVGNDGREEGCYGMTSSGNELPWNSAGICSLSLSSVRQCGCP